uniref:RING-type E3 ubiquitin transferase n=1 Tax=Urocitellus parryii TaxID=9999 RepID=A0A8D2HG19_UROPR
MLQRVPTVQRVNWQFLLRSFKGIELNRNGAKQRFSTGVSTGSCRSWRSRIHFLARPLHRTDSEGCLGDDSGSRLRPHSAAAILQLRGTRVSPGLRGPSPPVPASEQLRALGPRSTPAHGAPLASHRFRFWIRSLGGESEPPRLDPLTPGSVLVHQRQTPGRRLRTWAPGARRWSPRPGSPGDLPGSRGSPPRVPLYPECRWFPGTLFLSSRWQAGGLVELPAGGLRQADSPSHASLVPGGGPPGPLRAAALRVRPTHVTHADSGATGRAEAAASAACEVAAWRGTGRLPSPSDSRGGRKMAEASAAGADAGAAVAAHRFFCHFCKGEVSPKLPEYICPRCESGFIEEVTDDSSFLGGGSSRIDSSTSTRFAENNATDLCRIPCKFCNSRIPTPFFLERDAALQPWGLCLGSDRA